MKLFSKTTLIFVVAVILGALVFQTSQKVQDSEEQLQQVERQIKREHEEIEVLQAEWEYLNRPQRLEELAKDKLRMQKPEGDAVVDRLDDVPSLNVHPGGDVVVPSYKPASASHSRKGGAL